MQIDVYLYLYLTVNITVYVPYAVHDAGAEDHVDDRVSDTVERRQTLDEDRHGVLVLATGGRQQSISVEQIEYEVRTPAEYERCTRQLQQQ